MSKLKLFFFCWVRKIEFKFFFLSFSLPILYFVMFLNRNPDRRQTSSSSSHASRYLTSFTSTNTTTTTTTPMSRKEDFCLKKKHTRPTSQLKCQSSFIYKGLCCIYNKLCIQNFTENFMNLNQKLFCVCVCV